MPITLTEKVLTGDVLHHWAIQEYEQHERGRWWFVAMLFLGIAFVGLGLFTQNFLFSLIIILFGIILFLQSHQTPIQVDFGITELGLVVGSRFYPYAELTSFYIIYQPPAIKSLFVETRSFFRPLLRVPLLDINPVEVRHTLRLYLEEDLDKEEEPLSETFGRNWKLH